MRTIPPHRAPIKQMPSRECRPLSRMRPRPTFARNSVSVHFNFRAYWDTLPHTSVRSCQDELDLSKRRWKHCRLEAEGYPSSWVRPRDATGRCHSSPRKTLFLTSTASTSTSLTVFNRKTKSSLELIAMQQISRTIPGESEAKHGS